MTALERSLIEATSALQSIGARFALVGGLAVSVRAEPRLTRDADLAVAVRSDTEAEQLVNAMLERGYRTLALVEQEATNRLASARLSRSAEPQSVVTDLLFASTGIEPEIVEAAEEIAVLPQLSLPVASVGHLLAMKLLARDDRRRPADADDLVALAAVATPADWAAAEQAVELIERRGFNRGRNLTESLQQLRDIGPY